MKKLAFALLAILALCAVADAGGHCVVRQRVVHHQAAVVVEPAVVAAVYAPVVAVPAYSVGYASNSLYEENERLKLEIKVQRLELQIQRMQSAPLPLSAPQPQAQIAPSPPAPLPQAQAEHPAVGIMRTNCASCHEANVAKGKGGGFTLFQGQTLAKLSCEQTLAMIFAVHDGDMPKGGKALADQDFGVLMQYLRATAKR